MADVLVTSRSFGEFAAVGNDVLAKANLSAYRPGPDERPITEDRLLGLVARHAPRAIITGTDPITSVVLTAAERLRIVVKHGVGVDNIDLGAATNLGVLVANAPDTNTPAVVDLTIAMILVSLRRIVRSVASARAGRWQRVVGHELGAQTVGIIGTGKIGSEVVRRLVPFGPNLLAYDVVRNDALAAASGLAYVTLEELLERSDVISLHVPLVPQTRHLIGANELARMKDDVRLVNIARGPLIDESALAKFLLDHPAAVAALDVFSTEPPEASPLLRLENVIPTTHIGGYTYEAMARMDRICAETVVAVLSGGSPTNLLNPEAHGRRSNGE